MQSWAELHDTDLGGTGALRRLAMALALALGMITSGCGLPFAGKAAGPSSPKPAQAASFPPTVLSIGGPSPTPPANTDVKAWASGWAADWQKQDFAAMARAEGRVATGDYADQYRGLWEALGQAAADAGWSADLKLVPRPDPPQLTAGGAYTVVHLGHLALDLTLKQSTSGWLVAQAAIDPATAAAAGGQRQSVGVWTRSLRYQLYAYVTSVDGLPALPGADAGSATAYEQGVLDLQRNEGVLVANEPDALGTTERQCAAQLQAAALQLVGIAQGRVAAAAAPAAATSTAAPPPDRVTGPAVAAYLAGEGPLLQACAAWMPPS